MPASDLIYTPGAPWENAGVDLPEGATLADIDQAGAFRDVERRPVYVAGLPPDASAGTFAIVEPTSGRVYSFVGSRYRIIQYRTLAEVVMRAVGREACWVSMGTVGAGARSWMVARLPTPIRVRGDESESFTYFVASSTHDLSGTAVFYPTSFRALCQNLERAERTLSIRLRRALTIRHTASAPLKLEAAEKAFATVKLAHERFGALANMLAAVHLSDEQVGKVIDATLPLKAKERPEGEEPAEEEGEEEEASAQPRTEAAREKVRELYERANGLLPPARGTAWALLNAVTEYSDHYRKVRVTKRAGDVGAARMDAAVFGKGALLKDRATGALLDVTGIKLAD